MDFINALKAIIFFDHKIINIVMVSLTVSFASTILATLFGVPFGIFVARKCFYGRRALITILNTLMSLPTVVVGLLVYSFLSRHGYFGELGLLYTKTAIIIGQFILAFPIIAGLTVASIRSMDKRIDLTIISLGADTFQGFKLFLNEARFGIMAAITAGFGRVFAEIGVSMMLGGNISGYTRTITTAIALETSKGEFTLGIALGIILLIVSFVINFIFTRFQNRMNPHVA